MLGVAAGATPSAAALPPSFRVTGVWFADAATGWVTGRRCQEPPQSTPGASGPASPARPACQDLIEATTDGGGTWQRRYAGANEVGPLRFVDRQTGWAIRSQGEDCSSSPADCRSALVATRDGGEHWTAVYTTPLQLAQPAFTTPSEGRLLGGRCSEPDSDVACDWQLLTTSDGGRAWRAAPLPVRSGYVAGGYAITLAHPTTADGWIAATTGGTGKATLLASHDAGKSWQALPDPGVDFQRRLFFRTANQGWLLAGGEPGAGSQRKELFGTTDGGHTWAKLAWTGGFDGPGSIGSGGLPVGGYVGPLVFSTARDGWIASPRGALLQSSDGGETWHPAPIADHFFSMVGFATAQLGWAVSVEGPGLWLTSDGGSTWHAVVPPSDGAP